MNESQLKPLTRTARIVRISLVLMLAVLFVFLLIGVRSYPPTENSFYPGCMLHRTTGLHCMGCGLTRSVYASLHADFEQSVAYHPLAVVLIPFFTYVLSRSLICWALNRPNRVSTSRFALWGLKIFITVLIVFAILRNLPWYPFTLLAPHEIPR